MSDKIQSQHIARKAVLYVRQSSAFQVLHNQESQKLQYAMQGRLRNLGFSNIEVIDEDLGRSAAGTQARSGFERMVAEQQELPKEHEAVTTATHRHKEASAGRDNARCTPHPASRKFCRATLSPDKQFERSLELDEPIVAPMIQRCCDLSQTDPVLGRDCSCPQSKQ